MQEISDANFLEENLTDINTNEKIDLNYIVESKYNGYKYEYEILTTADACHENIISKDASIAITSMTFYRDSVSEANKTEKLLQGHNYIIDVKVQTTNISNGTSLGFITKKYNEEITWGNGTITVQDNKASFQISVPGAANLGEYVVVVLNNDLQVTSNFKIIKDVETILQGNVPDLLNGNLTPVVYDESNKKWRVADPNDVWYDYSNQWWANAVILKDGVNKNIGDFITLDEQVSETSNNGDVNAMYVWIPRFEYTINATLENGYIETEDIGKTFIIPGEIDVNFIPASQTVASGAEFVHPAFWWDKDSDGNREDGEELSGIWVGKFETTNQYTLPFNALAYSWDGETPNLKELFDKARNYESYLGESPTSTSSEFDAHAIKNSEWAAVAYLSQSKYGKQGNAMYEGYYKKVFKNNYVSYVESTTGYPCYASNFCRHSTGYSSGKNNAYSSEYKGESGTGTGDDYFRYDNILDRGSGQGSSGAGASTTGNIYGIYDMAGGVEELVMASYIGGDYLEKGGFSSSGLNSKYFDSYTSTDVTTACNGEECYGHALSETKNWYEEYEPSIQSWFTRGSYESSYYASIFYTNGVYFDSSKILAFRSVLLRG